MLENPDYLKELSAFEEEWEALEKQFTVLRSKRRHIVAKRKYDYILKHQGKVWTKMRGPGGQPTGSYSWTTAPIESSSVWRSDTEKRAFWYARDIENLRNITGIEVVPVEKK